MMIWIVILTVAVGVLMAMNIYWGVQIQTILGPPILGNP